MSGALYVWIEGNRASLRRGRAAGFGRPFSREEYSRIRPRCAMYRDIRVGPRKPSNPRKPALAGIIEASQAIQLPPRTIIPDQMTARTHGIYLSA
jgi:hypothetical protein